MNGGTMNDERDGPRADGVSDPEVRALYRELAGERTPASLNEAVLARATRSAGRGYAHAIAWMRPMAWAATIGLCLAIVLELADVPEPELRVDGPQPPSASPGERHQAEGSAAYRVTDAPLLEEAAALANVRSESDGAASRPLAETSAAGPGEPACSAESTATPETWLECIEALREAGRGAEADEQEARLGAAFPDFELR